MTDHRAERAKAAKVVPFGGRVEAHEKCHVIAEHLTGRSGLGAEQVLPSAEPFRAVLGLLGPGDAVRIRQSCPAGGASVDVAIAITLGGVTVRSDGIREKLIARALSSALSAAYPGLIFAPAPIGVAKVAMTTRALSPEARRLTAWQARALHEAPRPHAITPPQVRTAGNGPAPGEARPDVGTKLALTGTALAHALESLGRELVIELELAPVELSAPVLRRLGAIEREVLATLGRSRDPLVDRGALDELARVRTLASEQTALRLRCSVASTLPLDDSEVDLVSNAIFNAPSRSAGAADDAEDVSLLLPRRFGPHAVEHLLSANVVAALTMTERPSIPSRSGGTLLGKTLRGAPVSVSLVDRQQHTYALGATGTGSEDACNKRAG